MIPKLLMLNAKQAAEVELEADISTLGSCQRVGTRIVDGVEVVAEIKIQGGLTSAQQHHILIHELIHLTGETLKEVGVTRRQPDEAFVTHAAGPLFAALACNGLLSSVDAEEARSWCWMGGEE